MSTVVMDKKEEIVMKLVHYLVTEENYTPIVVNGVKNEVWLENIEGPYKIIRINSNYVHNREQYNFDIFKINNISRQIKKKTLSLKMNVLNIMLDLNESVKIVDTKNVNSIVITSPKDITKNTSIIEAFPDIKNNLIKKDNNIDLIIDVTNDINHKTAKDNERYEATFRPKKIIVTYIIIALCVITYILQMLNGNITLLGANYGPLVKEGQYYRLITSIFLHGSIIHLLCNMYSLFIIGSQVETFIGRTKYALIYIISGLCGSLLSIVLSHSLSVGASGAIFGLMGSLLYFGYHYRLYLGSVMKSQIIPLIAINLLIGFTIPGIDVYAHIGGLIGGYLSTMALGVKYKTSKTDQINGIIVLSLYILFMIYMGIIK